MPSLAVKYSLMSVRFISLSGVGAFAYCEIKIIYTQRHGIWPKHLSRDSKSFKCSR